MIQLEHWISQVSDNLPSKDTKSPKKQLSIIPAAGKRKENCKILMIIRSVWDLIAQIEFHSHATGSYKILVKNRQ